MVTLAGIPGRFHAALAAERVDVIEARDGESCVVVDYVPGLDPRSWIMWGLANGPKHRTTNSLTLPATAHNARALAVVLAEACGLDVSGGVIARLTVERLLWLEVNTITDGVDLARAGFAPRPWHALHRGCPALATINPTAPDALFRALVAALCALETA